jgi:hypothetical protein
VHKQAATEAGGAEQKPAGKRRHELLMAIRSADLQVRSDGKIEVSDCHCFLF